jgi:serine/threonine protein kinase
VVHEYASHGSIYDMLKNQGRFSENLARYFFQQMLCAVRYCHERGVTHGSIQLKHLLIKLHSIAQGTAPVLKLTNFEFAKEDMASENHTGRSSRHSRSNAHSTRSVLKVQHYASPIILELLQLIPHVLLFTSDFNVPVGFDFFDMNEAYENWLPIIVYQMRGCDKNESAKWSC